jgi:hypothetical protein
MDVSHPITPDGESVERWAINDPGFIGTIRQLTDCARCGCNLPAQPHCQSRRVGHRPVTHILCDDCYEQLPE